MTRWVARALSLATVLSYGTAAASPTDGARAPLPPAALLFGDCQAPLPYAEGGSIDDFARALAAWRAIRPRLYGPTPLPDQIRWIPDTAPQAELHLVYDEWPAMRQTLKVMVQAAASQGEVVLHVRGPGERYRAEAFLRVWAPPPAQARVSSSPAPDSLWLRDFGGQPVVTASGPARLDFNYSLDCANDDAWPIELGANLRSPLWVEGGNLLGDGDRCYATEDLARLNGMTPAEMASTLAGVGCGDTVWLLAAPDTIAHVDPFLLLGDPGVDGRPTFVLAEVAAAVDPQTHAVLEENARRLATLGTVHRAPVAQVRPLAPQLNALVFNGVVFVPELGGALDPRVLDAIGKALPGRTLVPVPADGLASLEGGPHCISATVPVPAR